MKSKEEIEQLAENSSEVQEATYTSQHKITYQHGYIDGYTQCQEDMVNEIQSLIDGYKSYILRLEEKFKDTCTPLTLEKIVTLESVVENLESLLNKQD